MILDTTTRKLQATLKASVATNQCPIIVDFVEFTSSATTPNIQTTLTNGTTPVDILAAPGSNEQRKVNGITISNLDTAAVEVTVMLDDNGTDYEFLKDILLPIGSSLQWTDTNGWSVISREGGIRQLREDWVQTFTANGTWVKSNGCRFFMVEVVGGGGGGGGGEGRAAGTLRAGGAGGGGGCRVRQLFLAKDLPKTVSVTVAAETSAAAGGTLAVGSNGSGGNQSSFGTYLIGYPGGGGCGGNGTTGAGGGGGGGGTGAGQNSTGNTSGAGGNAMLAGVNNAEIADYRGAGGTNGTSGSAGYSSYMGGGGGGPSSSSAGSALSGGASFFSASGGGGGGGVTAANTAANGAPGSFPGGVAITTTASGLFSNANLPGRSGFNIPGFCGQGGIGGGGNSVTTGGVGGNGGFPGGGGGGGGGGTSTGGAGGRGSQGVVRVWGW